MGCREYLDWALQTSLGSKLSINFTKLIMPYIDKLPGLLDFYIS